MSCPLPPTHTCPLTHVPGGLVVRVGDSPGLESRSGTMEVLGSFHFLMILAGTLNLTLNPDPDPGGQLY